MNDKMNEQPANEPVESGTPVRKGRKKGFNAWWQERSLPEKIIVVIGFGLAGLALLALAGWVVMLLWNWLMPDIFGLKHITYWQAWGLMVLSWILFKGSSSSSSSGSSRSTERKRKEQLRRAMQDSESPAGED